MPVAAAAAGSPAGSSPGAVASPPASPAPRTRRAATPGSTATACCGLPAGRDSCAGARARPRSPGRTRPRGAPDPRPRSPAPRPPRRPDAAPCAGPRAACPAAWPRSQRPSRWSRSNTRNATGRPGRPDRRSRRASSSARPCGVHHDELPVEHRGPRRHPHGKPRELRELRPELRAPRVHDPHRAAARRRPGLDEREHPVPAPGGLEEPVGRVERVGEGSRPHGRHVAGARHRRLELEGELLGHRASMVAPRPGMDRG